MGRWKDHGILFVINTVQSERLHSDFTEVTIIELLKLSFPRAGRLIQVIENGINLSFSDRISFFH